MLTPKDILDISEPVEAIYQRTVDELLINIARHFRTDATERTRYWEIKKLSEMGALTKESAAIIAKNTGMLPEEVKRAFLQVSEKACLDVDPQLRAAAEQGILQDPGTSPSTSPTVRRMVQSYVDQAVDKTNMPDTPMLESTRRAYLQSVQTVVSEEQLEEAKMIISAEALEVATGQETRTRAIRKAMDQLGRNGIAGFYDRSGRAWSPDAYAAMVVRTTSHNAAIGAIRSRQQEYGGGDIFQVSTHGGARPLCYPYQGKFYTWSASSGTFKDGAGQEHKYEPITATSYGEPAGLFGINCGHHPIPMIPGFSYPQEGPTQDEEENRREYEESQQQRQLERNIREAKRNLAMADATGDEDLVDQMEAKVKQEQAKMRAFIKETGRARRYDREQIPDGTTGPIPKLQTRRPTTPAPTPAAPRRAAFTPAKTLAEAAEYADRFVEPYKTKYSGAVDFSGIEVQYANGMNRAMTEVLDVYSPDYTLRNIRPFNTREKRFKDTTAEAAYQWGLGDLFFNKKIYKSEKEFAKHLSEYHELIQTVLPNIDGLIAKYQNDTSQAGRARLRYLTALRNTGRTNVSPPDAYGSTVHELGHFLDDRLFRKTMKDAGFDLRASFDRYATGISAYATADLNEYVAESFTAFWLGEEDKVDPDLARIFREAQK